MTVAVAEAEIEALVRRFYARARADARLGPIFNGAIEDWEEHFGRLTAFWSSVMLGSGRYKGNPFGAHVRLPILPGDFPIWLGLWRQTTAEVFAPEVARAFDEKAERIAASLSQGLFFRPETVG